MEDGVILKVIPGEPELAVPGVFQRFSRVGNVSNTSFRLQTTLQACKSIHQLALHATLELQDDDETLDWKNINKQAKIGMTPKHAKNVGKLQMFVQRWSGGKKSTSLEDLS